MNSAKQMSFVRQALEDGWTLCNLLLQHAKLESPYELSTINGAIAFPETPPETGGVAPLLQDPDLARIIHDPQSREVLICEHYLARPTDRWIRDTPNPLMAATNANLFYYNEEVYAYARMGNLGEVVAAVSATRTYRLVGIEIDPDDFVVTNRSHVDLAFMNRVVAAVRRVFVLAHDGEALMIANASGDMRPHPERVAPSR